MTSKSMPYKIVMEEFNGTWLLMGKIVFGKETKVGGKLEIQFRATRSQSRPGCWNITLNGAIRGDFQEEIERAVKAWVKQRD